MFENLFTPSPLIWSGLIAGAVALPVLIHLINMLRHKRVKWAAMDFLMLSHKRQRNWIWLRQLLLLLSRIAILLLGLFMLANIGCENPLANGLTGGRTSHHYVLLDDSFSMSDTSGGSSAFDHALQTLQTIASRAGNRPNQRMTLLRFSRAAVSFGGQNQASNSVQNPDQKPGSELTADQVMELEDQLAGIADLNGVQIDSKFAELLAERRSSIDVSQMAVGPEAALTLVQQLIEQRNTEEPAVHLLSDFRRDDWRESAELRRSIESVSRFASIEFVRCEEQEHSNLAITLLKPVRNIRAAEVPLFCDVRVQNFSKNPVSNLTVEISSVAFESPDSAAVAVADVGVETTELPTVFIKEILPGESATQRFSVFFASPGSHVIQARLPEDAVASDNLRQTVIRIEESDKVLLVDDFSTADKNKSGAFYLSSVFEPGGNRRTGVSTQTVTRDWFRSVDADDLKQYTAIYLLDLPRLELETVNKISDYVKAGGGLGIFLGPKTNVDFYNESLYRRGTGFFPIPLDRTFTLPERHSSGNAAGTADVLPTDHPVFAALKQTSGGSLLDLVQIESVLSPPIDWSDELHSEVRVAAWVRGGNDEVGRRPLVVEKAFGGGRVAVVTTTAAPQWHNWNKNPTFVVMLLDLQDFLSAGPADSEDFTVGNPVQVIVDADQFRSDAVAIVPVDSRPYAAGPSNDPSTSKVTRNASRLSAEKTEDGNTGQLKFQLESERAGIHDLLLTGEKTGAINVRRYAVNVDKLEGDLDLASDVELTNEFALAAPEIVSWNAIDPDPYRTTASPLSKWLLPLLIFLLVLEQILAWALSFHPKRSESLQTRGDVA